jgi:GDP-L-fucose synthase
MERTARILVAGAGGFIGSGIVRALARHGFANVIDPADQPDYHDGAAVDAFFRRTAPEYVFVAAGRTAGIEGNRRFPADLMLDNLLIAAHLIPAAAGARVTKLLYLSSSCTYPRLAPQPLHAASLWSGPLEPTSAAYATAKLAGVMLCQAYRHQHGARFISAIGADAYGPGDDFDPDQAHVVGALLRRFHEAREAAAPAVDVWGSGAPRREFIYVDDLADACVFAMRHYDDAEPLNLGAGRDGSIADLAAIVRDVVGFAGQIRFDRTRPDGMPFKGLDSTRLRDMGWRPAWDLRAGLEETYRWWKDTL